MRYMRLAAYQFGVTGDIHHNMIIIEKAVELAVEQKAELIALSRGRALLGMTREPYMVGMKTILLPEHKPVFSKLMDIPWV